MGNRLSVLLVISLLGLAAYAPVGGSDEGDPERGLGPFTDELPVWNDSLDDLSHVYRTVGVDVSGGDAFLEAGETTGWIASSIITPPEGYRYDFVLLDIETPGNSYIEVSILDATESSSEVGFPNETIPGFKWLRGDEDDPYTSVVGVDWQSYPEIRLQLTLQANGSASPQLYSWALHFVHLDEWREDFLGTWKMTNPNGLSISGGRAGINMTKSWSVPNGTQGDIRFPTIAIAPRTDVLRIYYPNPELAGYLDEVKMNLHFAHSVAFDDMDMDGDLDLIAGQNGVIQIWFRNNFGQWDASGAMVLNISANGNFVVTGDFNGDGEPDVGAALQSAPSKIFLNQGGGSFNREPDITFTTSSVPNCAAGDLNGDGFDDFLSGGKIFFGGPDGPDTTPNITILEAGAWNSKFEDIDGDGHLDVLMANGAWNGDPCIWLGGPDGPDTIMDYRLTSSGPSYRIDAGDFNGDGYQDIVTTSANYPIEVFNGSSKGWNSSDKHQVATVGGDGFGLAVYDINQDDFDDIIVQSDGLKVFYGGTTLPTSPNITNPSTSDCYNIAIAPMREGLINRYGRFHTEEIVLPEGKRWDFLEVSSVVPENTSVYYAIRDKDDIQIRVTSLPTDREPGVDLSSIDEDVYGIIKVSVYLRTNSNVTTPYLDYVRVRWIDKMIWREQFFTEAKMTFGRNLGVEDGTLQSNDALGQLPQIMIVHDRWSDPDVYFDAGGLDYRLDEDFGDLFGRTSASIEVVDVNNDGLQDLGFANLGNTGSDYEYVSTIYLNSPLGFIEVPTFTFPTVGARDILIKDLNDDGHFDVVFAQEKNTTTFDIRSTLFWGSATGWNATPDLRFATMGADDVEATDLNGDGMLDLVFACYRSTGQNIDSMVFLQDTTGYCGTVPSYGLPTHGARGVAVADLDDDHQLDLVFANSMEGGLTEVDSYIYWGKAGGGFDPSPSTLRTSGAQDVMVDDLDNDGDLDIVFANSMDNSGGNDVSSYVYLNDGSRDFGDTPFIELHTPSAMAVFIADLDTIGWKDLVFACHMNGTLETPSLVYLGGPDGWDSTPSIELETSNSRGMDVVVANLFRPEYGSYMSNPIVVKDPFITSGFHTFRYSAMVGDPLSAKLKLLDAVTYEVLAETTLQTGSHEWVIDGIIKARDHPSIRVAVVISGLDQSDEFMLDDLWLNWTERIRTPPQVLDLSVVDDVIYRLQGTTFFVNATDDFNRPEELSVTVEHRLNGTSEEWSFSLLGTPSHLEGNTWSVEVQTKVTTPVGRYDFRVMVSDPEGDYCPFIELPNALQVLNNLPTAPEIRLEPEEPKATSMLNVVVVRESTDVESTLLTYRYLWFKNGVLMEGHDSDSLPSSLMSKGQNWSVEVRAFDGEDESEPALAWVLIGNTAPVIDLNLPDPEFDEDTVDSEWLDLSTGFRDIDGDPLTWSLKEEPEHLTVTIDPVTGKVTLAPDPDWYGEETLTFLASDGELTASQEVTVHVLSVNDHPVITHVDGEPVTGPTIEYNIRHGQELLITYTVEDVEGDEIRASTTSTVVTFDEVKRTILFTPGKDEVGTLTFTLRVWDVVSPDQKVTLDFVIVVENENDPMEEPRITNPLSGSDFKVNQSFSLIGRCEDPDVQFGQVLNFTWSSNVSGVLGYGSSLTVAIAKPGTHLITLTVSDGEFVKTTTVTLTITPTEVIEPPPSDGDDEDSEPRGYTLPIIIVVVFVSVVVAFLVVRGSRKADELEAEDEAEERREDMASTLAAFKEAADALEATKAEEVASKEEDVDLETAAVPQIGLSMEARETEAASTKTMALFGAGTSEPVMSKEEQEQLRLDNLKRKYQNAIGRLPYGIPSPELRDMDWVELAAALATGAKKTTPGGRELTEIDGRWYYSDVKDTGTFLKEHGAKPKAEKKRAEVTTDKADLLAKLEERFILGEISEEAYNSLKEKYDKEE